MKRNSVYVMLVGCRVLGALSTGTRYAPPVRAQGPAVCIDPPPPQTNICPVRCLEDKFTRDGVWDTDLDFNKVIHRSREFVRQQYIDFLGREPDTSGQNFWVSVLESGCPRDQVTGAVDQYGPCMAANRAHIGHAFIDSGEYQNRVGYSTADNQNFVMSNYGFSVAASPDGKQGGFLGRDADQSGLNFRTNDLNATGDRRHIVRAFIESAEYYQRFEYWCVYGDGSYVEIHRPQ